MGIQYIDIDGKRMAILPAADLERLLDDAENHADAHAADSARERREAGEEYFPAELVNRLIAGDNPVAVYRAFRGLTQVELAGRIGMSKVMISSIERGKNAGRLSTLRKIARALSIDLEDLLPLDPEQSEAA